MSPTTRKKTQRKVGDIIILVIFWKKRCFFTQLFRSSGYWIYRSFWLALLLKHLTNQESVGCQGPEMHCWYCWTSGLETDMCFLWALRSGLEAEGEILEKEHHWHTKHSMFIERFRFFLLNCAGLSYWKYAPTWNIQICRVILETNGVGGVAVLSAEASFKEKRSWI